MNTRLNSYLRLRPPTALIALVVAAIACGGGLGTDEPATSVGEDPSVLFSDDFGDPDSGWDRVTQSDYTTDYGDGYYQILVNETDTDVWANPGQSFTDAIVTVEATKAGGPDDNDFGVICRYQDEENFYFFVISSDGFYGIGKVQDGQQELLSGTNMEPTDAIRQGEATNTVRGDCAGDRLTLRVNGTEVKRINDTTFTSGDVGLIAGTFDESGTEIRFDNFEVRQP